VLQGKDTEEYYYCCGKSICAGCINSFRESGCISKCPFCNSDQADKTVEEETEDMMKRVAAKEPSVMGLQGNHYEHGLQGFQQDHAKALEQLYARVAVFGSSVAHCNLGKLCHKGGDIKKAKFHLEAAAMAGCKLARCINGYMEQLAVNVERAVKHWTIAASAGDYEAMHQLRTFFEQGAISRESIDSTLIAYNNSCAEIRSEARDACMRRVY
jgi:hypothetical protein